MKKIISATLAVMVAFTCLAGCQKAQRNTENLAMYTENFSVTKSMLTYCFNTQYRSFVTANAERLEDYELDTTQPLDTQDCILNNANWYDYFMDIAKNRLEQCLIVAEKAKLDGKELSKKEEKAIEEDIVLLKDAAKKEKKNLADYIEDTFGDGVTEDDIIQVSKMEQLVNKYYDKFESTLDTGKKAVKKYYEGHKRLYSTVDYLSFYVAPLGDSAQEVTDAKRTALLLSQAKDPDSFLEMVEDYVNNYYTEYYGVKLSKKELKQKIAAAKESCEVTGAGYDASSTASRWAFDPERKVNDTTYIEDKENNGYFIYLLKSLPDRQTYNAVSVRQIVFAIDDYDSEDKAMQAAQETILNLEKNDYSADYFKRIAEEQSADTLSKSNGGLYENLSKGNLVDAKELEEWIFSDDREEGDITLLQTAKYGYHVVYIEEIGEPVWYLRAREGMVSARFSEYVSDLGDDHVVYINDNIVYTVLETEIKE